MRPLLLPAVLLFLCLASAAQPRPAFWREPGNVAAIDFANPPAHAAWLMRYLGRVSDAQLTTGLKAAGADDGTAACFQKALRARIDGLRKAARERIN